MDLINTIGDIHAPDYHSGHSLRTLRQLLDELDPKQYWDGLKKILTPEGHYLWLCEYHANEYKI